jgi:hypothetical protein
MQRKVVEHYNPQFLYIGDYVFSYAYPVAFLGACFYGITSLINVDPSTIIANKNISVALNLFIGLCGVISLFAWLNFKGNVPVIGNTLLPNGNSTIKANVNSSSTY